MLNHSIANLSFIQSFLRRNPQS